MNRRLSALDKYLLVSNSDAHSPAKLGREANLLVCALSYPALKRALDTGEGFRGTIEFFPEEGKYHLDGHRACNCCLEPEETRRLDGRCPVCGRKLTVGVLHRVEALADRAASGSADGRPFESLMPLPELLADCLGVSPASKKVQAAYLELLKKFGPEFHILRELTPETVEAQAGFAVGEALRRLRAGRVLRKAGYDGEYGVISLFAPHELETLGGQLAMPGLDVLAPRRPARRAAQAATSVTEEAQAAAPTGEALNPAQQAAVEADAPVTMVVAGPGTGKTKTLVARVARLIGRGVSPAEITAVTFTRQAAAELRERLTASLGKKAVRGLTVGTFHAIALTMLPEKPLLGGVQALELARAALAEAKCALAPAEFLRLVSAKKNGLNSPDTLPEAAFVAYAAQLEDLNVRDLDDVLLEALALDVRGQRCLKHLLVDEFQDINPVQHGLVRHWMAAGESLFVIGDPDQSIYGFSGANARCFEALQADFPAAQVIRLTENYRSAPAVLASALAVIGRNPGEARTLQANRPAGAPVRVVSAPDELSEGIWIANEVNRLAGGIDMLDAQAAGTDRAGRAFSEIAVLCRTRRQLEKIETCLAHDGIPCVISGRDDALNDRRVQGLLAFFRSLLDLRDSGALAQALTDLFGCPAGLAEQAAAVFAGLDAPDLDAVAADFERQAPLRSWLEAAREFEPRLQKDKPRRLLEQLAKRVNAKNRAVERLLNIAVFRDSMEEFLADVLLGEEGDLRRLSGAQYASGAVRLMTLHGAKGLEFPVVFLAGATRGELPLEREDAVTDIEEERRLFFVGMTRAREELIITHSGEGSAFLRELPEDVRREQARGRSRLSQGIQLSMF